MQKSINILFIGDVIGKSGVSAIFSSLGGLKKKHKADFVVANCENANNGYGITEQICENVFKSGVDVITTGNHAFHDIADIDWYLKKNTKVLVPGNYPSIPYSYFSTINLSQFGYPDKKLNVINLQGRFNMTPIDCPFAKADSILKGKDFQNSINIIDFHAEYTAEKEALALHLNGRVSAVIGTHTHVQTADERIFNKGTAYITDCGGVRVLRSCIGFSYETSSLSFLGQVPAKHEPCEGMMTISGAVIEVSLENNKAISIKRLSHDVV